MDNCILELTGIEKFFPGIKALDKVNFKIRPGEVHALIGENGAGKSTLVKILTGVYQPDGGTIFFNKKKVEFKSPLASQKIGISAIHQEATMFLELSVTENIFMAHQIKSKKTKLLDWNEMRKKTKALLEKLEIEIDPDTKVKNLSIAQRHLIEIVKALSFDVKVIIMDEPTSALSLNEVEHLYKIVRQLKDEGKAIVFISHKFDEIFEITDHFTVLRDGCYIGEGKIKETSVDKIVTMMVGRSLKNLFPKANVKQGETVLKVENLTSTGVFKDISFELHEGEILGFFGLVGSGRSEIMRSIFGIDDISSGKIFIDGSETQIKNAKQAMKKGIAFVPEDRQSQGAIVKMSIKDNMTLPIIDKISFKSILNKKAEKEIAENYGKKLDVKAAAWDQLVESLSGGNQQKVVLAKWLATYPKILILDEPTKGIDVGTKAEVHKFMGELVKQGLSIILVSSELPEILGMSDNIIVIYDGKISAKYSKKEANENNIIKAATGNIK